MDLVIPLIEESLVPPAKDFFEEDGLALWQGALYNSASVYHPSAESGLIRLFPGLLGILGENMDLLPQMLGLLDSYILLDVASILQVCGYCKGARELTPNQIHGAALCASLAKALETSKANAESTRRILVTILLLVRTAPLGVLAQHLLDTSLFQSILIALEDDKASGLVLASYLEILGRIALLDPQAFLGMVAESAKRLGKDGHKVLEETLDAYWRNFDYVGEMRARKGVAMGAGSLLTTVSLRRVNRKRSRLIVTGTPSMSRKAGWRVYERLSRCSRRSARAAGQS